MPTAATDFTKAGMSAIAATELVAQIDETAASTEGYPDATLMTGVGIPAALATEIAAQCTSGTGNSGNLMNLGVPALLASQIDAAIDAANE